MTTTTTSRAPRTLPVDPSPDLMHPESSWTAPHTVCPNPGRWTAPDSDSTEHEVSVLLYGLIRALQPELVVETGSAFGHTSRAIGTALMMNGHGRLVSLEVDQERAAAAEQRCAGLPVEVRQQSSLEYTPDGPVGFCFFDSLYELRAAEFRRYRTLGVLEPGTVVAFHDWTSGLRGHYRDVRADVDQLATERLLRPVYIPTPRGLVLCEGL